MKMCVRINAVDALRAGRDAQGRQLIEVDPANLTLSLREELIRISQRDPCGSDCQAQFHIRGNTPRQLVDGAYSDGDPTYPALVEPTPEALVVLLLDVRTERLRREAAKQAMQDEIVNLILALSPEDLVYDRGRWYRNTQLQHWEMPTRIDLGSKYPWVRIPEDPRLDALMGEAEALCVRRNAEAKAQETEIDMKRDAQKAAEEAAKAAALDARDTWIREHGSPRLQRCLEEGITCGGLYRDERLALERPGWRWETDEDPGNEDPINPPQEALDLLDTARASLGEEAACKLVFWPPTEVEDEYGDSCEDMPARYAVTSTFLDRPIIWEEAIEAE